MKHLFKKFTAVLLILLLIAAPIFSGCSTNETQDQTTTSNDTTDAPVKGDTTVSSNDTTEPEVDEATEPEDTTVEPEDTMAEPEVTTTEPEDTTAEPEDTTAEPEDTTVEPEDTMAEPEVTTTEPEVTTTEPEVTTTEPEVTTTEPEDTTAEPEPEVYSVSLDTNIEAAGSASGEGEYEQGSSVTVVAATNAGYTFCGWFEGNTLVSVSESYSFELTGDRSLTAKWQINTYSIVVSSDNANAGSVSGGGDYDHGASVTVVATKNVEHYNFLGWYDGNDLVSENMSYSFEATSEIALTAKWEIKSYTVSVSSDNSEVGNASGGGTYVHGTEITVKATKLDVFYKFLGWYEGTECVSSSESYTFTTDEAKSLIAKWEYNTEWDKITYTVDGDNITVTGLKDTSATALNIPDGVTNIKYSAFSGCADLAEISIPDSVTSIEAMAFSNTAYYKNDSNWENGALYIGKFLIETDLYISKSYSIKEGTLVVANAAISDIKEISVPASLTHIGIGHGVNSIIAITASPDNAVYMSSGNCLVERATNTVALGCKNSIIPDSVKAIGDYAFNKCSSITEITIPESVESIGNYAFDMCSGLAEITISKNVKSIGDYAFRSCTGLTEVIIPNSVTSIGGSAFNSCTGLTKVTIGNGVKSIGIWAFYGCTGLTEITIPDSVTTIKSFAFSRCTGLTSVTIGSGVSSIGSSAFSSCTKLTSVEFINTAGWCAGGAVFTPEDLENKGTAATFLTTTYFRYEWIRTS